MKQVHIRMSYTLQYNVYGCIVSWRISNPPKCEWCGLQVLMGFNWDTNLITPLTSLDNYCIRWNFRGGLLLTYFENEARYIIVKEPAFSQLCEINPLVNSTYTVLQMLMNPTYQSQSNLLHCLVALWHRQRAQGKYRRRRRRRRRRRAEGGHLGHENYGKVSSANKAIPGGKACVIVRDTVLSRW